MQNRELLFIQDGVGGRQRSKQARAHVAKVNRQRQKDEKLQRLEESASGKSTLAGSSLRTEASAPSKLEQQSSFQEDGHRKRTQTLNLFEQPRRKAGAYVSYRRCNSTPAIPPLVATISPVLGANNFNMKSYPEAISIASFLFNHVMDNWLAPAHRSSWFSAFFHDPLTFHCLSYSCGILQDVSSGREIQHARLLHRHRTIQLVNQQLGHLDTNDPEPIVLAILTLWRINTEHIAQREKLRLLFTPHMRSASWVLIFGKLGGEDVHAQALAHLVKRVGGLGNFKTLPGLQESLALADVLDSSSKAKKPNFPSIWSAEQFITALEPALNLLPTDFEGEGFRLKVPGGLPADALLTFVRLSMLDKLLDHFNTRATTQNEGFFLATLGNAVQHDLLSMTSYEDLDESSREHCSPTTYEACRISSVIYSNSCIFPISPEEVWLEKSLRQLRQLLETSNTNMWAEDAMPLLIWMLFVGGMASFWTNHRTFFVNNLRQALKFSRISEWSEVNAVLKQFLWRNSICGCGASTLWSHVQVED